MERLEFISTNNNLADIEFFRNNYDILMTIYGICNLVHSYEIDNLVIEEEQIYLEIKKAKTCYITSSSPYNNCRYTVDANIKNKNTLSVSLKKVS